MLITNNAKHQRLALELKGTIINRNHPLVKITSCILLEKRILIDELEHNEDNSFAAFDNAKFLKGLKIKKYYQMKFV